MASWGWQAFARSMEVKRARLGGSICRTFDVGYVGMLQRLVGDMPHVESTEMNEAIAESDGDHSANLQIRTDLYVAHTIASAECTQRNCTMR